MSDLTIGEIVSWTSPKEIHIHDLRKALLDAGLDPRMAKDMRPANAFKRAIKSMEDNRVIKMVSHDRRYSCFQFTTEQLQGDEFQYSKETTVRLDKQTGNVYCTNTAIANAAQQLLNDETNKRGANDVTRIVQGVFDSESALIPLRESGGVYFVPQVWASLCDKVEAFLKAAGGQLNRWAVAGTNDNKQTAARNVKDHIVRLTEQFAHANRDLKTGETGKVTKAKNELTRISAMLSNYSLTLDECYKEAEEAYEQVRDALVNVASGNDAGSLAALNKPQAPPKAPSVRLPNPRPANVPHQGDNDLQYAHNPPEWRIPSTGEAYQVDGERGAHIQGGPRTIDHEAWIMRRPALVTEDIEAEGRVWEVTNPYALEWRQGSDLSEVVVIDPYGDDQRSSVQPTGYGQSAYWWFVPVKDVTQEKKRQQLVAMFDDLG